MRKPVAVAGAGVALLLTLGITPALAFEGEFGTISACSQYPNETVYTTVWGAGNHWHYDQQYGGQWRIGSTLRRTTISTGLRGSYWETGADSQYSASSSGGGCG